MAIPLRKLSSADSKSSSSSSHHHQHHPRDSLDSETSAILSYALGNKEGLDTDDEADDSPRGSTTLDDDNEDEFFRENDPLTSDYEPFPLKKVKPPPFGRSLFLEITTISNISLYIFRSLFIGLVGRFDWIFVKGIF